MLGKDSGEQKKHVLIKRKIGGWEGTLPFPGVLSASSLVTSESLNCLSLVVGGKKFVFPCVPHALSSCFSLFLPPLFSHQGRVCRVSSAPSPTQPETHSSFPLFSPLLPPLIVSSAPEHAWIINLPWWHREWTNQGGLYWILKLLLSPWGDVVSLASALSHISLSLQPIFDLVRWISQALMHPSWFDMISFWQSPRVGSLERLLPSSGRGEELHGSYVRFQLHLVRLGIVRNLLLQMPVSCFWWEELFG